MVKPGRMGAKMPDAVPVRHRSSHAESLCSRSGRAVPRMHEGRWPVATALHEPLSQSDVILSYTSARLRRSPASPPPHR